MRSVDDDFSPEAEEQVRALLAAQPRPPMPAEVRDRILTALAAEPQPDFASHQSGGRNKVWWAVGAVAAAFVLFAGVVALPRTTQPPTATVVGEQAPTVGTDQGPGVAVPAACADQPLTYNTGTRYLQASFDDQAQDLAAYCSTAKRVQAATPAPTRSAVPAAMNPRLAQRSVSCVVKVAPSADVLIVDRGFYGSDPATIAVVGPPDRALVIDCREQPERVLLDVRLD